MTISGLPVNIAILRVNCSITLVDSFSECISTPTYIYKLVRECLNKPPFFFYIFFVFKKKTAVYPVTVFIQKLQIEFVVVFFQK